MQRSLVLAAVAACLAGLPASAAPASSSAVEALRSGALPTSYSQYRPLGHRAHGHRHGWGRGHGWRRGYGYRRGPGVGAAVGAGVAGLAAGAIIGGAIANAQSAPVTVQGGPDPDAIAACARRFRSYDARSGTYLGNDGARHPCP